LKDEPKINSAIQTNASTEVADVEIGIEAARATTRQSNTSLNCADRIEPDTLRA
jgi:hypothetical protein